MHWRSLTALTLAVAACGLAGLPAHAQTDTIIQLTYPEDGSQHCDFVVPAGNFLDWAADGSNVKATGHFDFSGSDCPQGNGGGTIDLQNYWIKVVPQTGSPSVADNTNPNVSVTLDDGDKARIQWKAPGADVCRFDGSSVPGSLSPGWRNNDYACKGGAACQAPQFLPSANGYHTFDTNGVTKNYKLQLKCIGFADSGNTQTRTVNLKVKASGGGDGGTDCPASVVQGGRTYTRQAQGGLGGSGSFSPVKEPTALTSWSGTLGWNFVGGQNTHYLWPGHAGLDHMFFFQPEKYIAIKFTVPQDFPEYANSGTDPYGFLDMTNYTAVTVGVSYTMSLSRTCGDFTPPQPECRAVVRTGDMALYWGAVRPPNPHTGSMCNLTAKTTGDTIYYLNIHPGKPDGSDGCTRSTCKMNIGIGGVNLGTWGSRKTSQ